MLGVQMDRKEEGKGSDFIFLVSTPATHTSLAPKNKPKLFSSVFFFSPDQEDLFILV